MGVILTDLYGTTALLSISGYGLDLAALICHAIADLLQTIVYSKQFITNVIVLGKECLDCNV
jgi:hypothetical protein